MPENEHHKGKPHPGRIRPKLCATNSNRVVEGRIISSPELVEGQYVELQLTSNFSFLRGASHPEEYVEQAARLGYSAVAITDRNSLSGIVRAHIAAKQHGIKLIVGAAVDFFLPDMSTVQLLLYPTNKKGYGDLSELLTRGKRAAPKGECYLILLDLFDYCTDFFVTLVNNRSQAVLTRVTSQLQEHVGSRLSLSLSRLYEPYDHRRIQTALRVAARTDVSLVATNDVHFHVKERRMLQDIVSCIREGVTLERGRQFLYPNGERYLKSQAEMQQLLKDFPDTLKRSCEIAAQIQFSLDELRYEYPEEICPEGNTPEQFLRQCTLEGAKKRYPEGIPESVERQLEYEFKLIRELNYEKYFLTVYDIVSFARSKGILCQGRGAAANSAVCYCLGITSVNPAQISILFERFVSKERNEPPDIDIDFEHERREEVLQYVYKTYGRVRAALVCEVITYRKRSAFREVGKVLGLSPSSVEKLLSEFSRWDKKQITSSDIRGAGFNPDDPAIVHTIHYAHEIKGFPRHLSQHVGGFVISGEQLSRIVPIENAAMPERTVIGWDKDDVDAMGMLKVDCLGLGMLTCIRKAFSVINDKRLSKDMLNLHTIIPDDPAVYDMICRAETIGVFQIESRAQMNMLPRLRPRKFYDLVIEVAIVRPGPIQGNMVHPYLKRRSGMERAHYPNKRIEQILGRTLGVPLFQEQAMELAMVAAGFSPGEADELRRAMAAWRKNENAMLKFRERIFSGMEQNGYSEEYAAQYFESIKGFAEYGFPESHAASFALLVYVSAWLKHYYPAVFAASLINSQPMGFYQPSQILAEVKRRGVTVLPVDVNHSKWDCVVDNEFQAIRLGLRLIRGFRKADAERLEAAVATHGPFTHLNQLFQNSSLSVSALRALARADAFQSFGLPRQRILWELQRYRDDSLPLLDSIEAPYSTARLPRIAPAQTVLKDYESLGLSLKAHPMQFIRATLNAYGITTAKELRSAAKKQNKKTILVAGLVIIRQKPSTARGVVFLTIEDETGTVNLICKPSVIEQAEYVIRTATVVLVKGVVSFTHYERDGTGGVLSVDVEEIMALEKLLQREQFSSRDFH